MNNLIFSGKLMSDVRVNKGEKGNFISFALYETGKGKDAPKLDVTQNFKGDEAPGIVEYLKKSATVIVSGTPYAKIGKDRDGRQVPVLAVFADKIDIVGFAKEKEKVESV
jgi:single-stranded DNA-binding protein